MITLQDLYEEAERFLWEHYRMTLLIDIDIEESLDNVQGAYEFTRKSPRRIVIADFVVELGEREVCLDILRHELVHYALHRLGRDFADGEDDFENELARHGISSTGTTRLGRYQLYQCKGCGGMLPFHRKFEQHELDTVVTACCDAKFTATGEQAVYDGRRRVY